jgi:serine phosphatase RsbU (regulator of sigma subunit)
MDRFKPADLVTCVIATLDPLTGHLRYASAGQLPALLTGLDGPARLDQATTPPLGANSHPRAQERIQAEATIGAGQVLLLYSDGLVERRRHDLHDSIDRLAEHAVGLPAAPDLAQAVTELIKQLDAPDRTDDDIAVLAIRREHLVRR